MAAPCTPRAAAATRSSANASSDCDFSTPIFRLPVRTLVSWSQHLRPAARRNANCNYAGRMFPYACTTSTTRAALATGSPSEVRHAQANRLARRREKLSAHYCLNPFSAVSVRLEQLSIACSHGRPKVLLQSLARNGALNGTLADVSIEHNQITITGNNSIGGNSNVHDCNSTGRYLQLTWKFVRRQGQMAGRSRKAASHTAAIRCTRTLAVLT